MIFYLFAILTIICVKSDEIEEYVNLIESEVARVKLSLRPKDYSEFQESTDNIEDYGIFDYIIVGGGSAGTVIANRLSEIEDNQVLLLEAGGDETAFTEIPNMMSYLQWLEYNWNYNTTPQATSCQGMIDKKCPFPRGKSLGGSSAINFVVYSRGNKRDFDTWHDQGNPGWSYDDILPYFKKSEKSKINGDDGFHGTNGYLNVEYTKLTNPLFTAFIEANVELGRKILDYNGREQLGTNRVQYTINNGRRHSTAKAFLKPIMHRANLKIQTKSLVTKILISSSSNRAYGVLFSFGGVPYRAVAEKEIILSAGSVGSPQLLMLSGVGPAKHLAQHKIPLIKDLPVGLNLQDHAVYQMLQFSTNYTEPEKNLRQHVEEYLKGYGQLTAACNMQGVTFVQTSLAKVPDYPDIELIFTPPDSSESYLDKLGQYNEEVYNTLFESVKPSQTFLIGVILLHPKSLGEIKLKSGNPYDHPFINSNHLSDTLGEDIETMYQGIQLALNIVQTVAFQKFNASLIYAPLAPCRIHLYLSRAYWYCQLRQLTYHTSHSIGTCKMGPNTSSEAVVDHELKVHGIRGLRVADASIIPLATSGHTNAPTIMIAEKVSDIIKNNNL